MWRMFNQREPGRFLTANWRYLLMLNYKVHPSIIAPHVPAGTEIDLHDGCAYISIVGFLFLNTRVLGVHIPLHVDFEEVNLRTYVRRKGPEGWRRGVVFVKEIVPRRAIAFLARAMYNENYVAMPMHHYIVIGSGSVDRRDVVEYAWRDGEQWSLLRGEPTGESHVPSSGTHEEFIVEHYWGYSTQRDGGTIEYSVEHPPWRLWNITNPSLECAVEELYGEKYADILRSAPDSAFLAEGSEVIVRKGRRIE